MKIDRRLLLLIDRKGNENLLHVLSTKLVAKGIEVDAHTSWQSVQKWSQNRADQPIFLLLEDSDNWKRLKKTLAACKFVQIFYMGMKPPADTENIHFQALSPEEAPELAAEIIAKAIWAGTPLMAQELPKEVEKAPEIIKKEKSQSIASEMEEPFTKQEINQAETVIESETDSPEMEKKAMPAKWRRNRTVLDWLKNRIPLLPSLMTGSVIFALLYFCLFSWATVYGMFHEAATGDWPSFLSWLNNRDGEPGLLGLMLILVLLSIGFDLATHTKLFARFWVRSTSLLLLFGSIFGAFALLGVRWVQEQMVPAVTKLIAESPWAPLFSEDSRFGGGLSFEALLMTVPLMFLFLFAIPLISEYGKEKKELKEKFQGYIYRNRRLASWLQSFGRLEEDRAQQDIVLGTSLKTGERVILPIKEQTLNILIVGGIGTGKTATGALNVLIHAIRSLAKFINAYPLISKREDYWTAKVAGRHLNGITVIEPTNDLCQKTLELAKAHGIPEEAITYLNPQDPNTPSLNPLLGPVEEVAEMLTQVIAGLDDSGSGGNFFFAQAQRSHLKQHVYLLKLHNPEKTPTFGVLVKMYNNPGLVHEMHMALKQRLLIQSVPADRDSQHLAEIMEELDKWFDDCIVPATAKGRGGSVPYDPATGKQVFVDSKAEHVQGLRNILNDMSTNTGLRRVLFGDSAFDFNRHLKEGGLLVVNTAKGQLNKLSGVLGKIVLMSLQSASYRRIPDVSPLHSLVVDEFPDYLYEDYRSFPVQSRKYQMSITNIIQTTSQLAGHYGEHYMTTLLAGMRNKMIYSDVPAYDAEYFSRQFGEEVYYEERVTETEDSLFSSAHTGQGTSRSYSRKREEAVRPSELIYQDVLTCTVKLVYGNKTMPAERIKVDYLPKEAFVRAAHQVDPQAAAYWLQESGLADAAAKTRQFAGEVFAESEQEAAHPVIAASMQKREVPAVNWLTTPYDEPKPDQPESEVPGYLESQLSEVHEAFLDDLQAGLMESKKVESADEAAKSRNEKMEWREE